MGYYNGKKFEKMTYFAADAHDLNSDGYLDILATHAQGKVEVLFGTPNGFFREGGILIDEELTEGTPAKIMDVDGDGIKDILAVRYDDSSLPHSVVFYGTENGLVLSPEKKRINYRSFMKNLRVKFTNELRKKCLEEKSGTEREAECDRPPEGNQINPLIKPYLKQVATMDMLRPLKTEKNGAQQLVVAGNNSLITLENNKGTFTVKHIEMIGLKRKHHGKTRFQKQIVSTITASDSKTNERPYIVAGVYGRTPSLHVLFWNEASQSYSDIVTWRGIDNTEAMGLSQLYGDQHEELITASFHMNEVGIFINNMSKNPDKPFGEEHFSLREPDSQSTGARALKVGDIDDDGHPEVLVLRERMNFFGKSKANKENLASDYESSGFEVIQLSTY
jgi:hypothetical protein